MINAAIAALLWLFLYALGGFQKPYTGLRVPVPL